MNILSLHNVGSDAIKQVANAGGVNKSVAGGNEDLFGSFFNSAIDNLQTTSSLSSDAKGEKMKMALGETENTHDLTIALEKSSTALQYTVALRDKFLAAYKEIIQMQI